MAKYVCIQKVQCDPLGGQARQVYQKDAIENFPEGVTPPEHCWVPVDQYKPPVIPPRAMNKPTTFDPSYAPEDTLSMHRRKAKKPAKQPEKKEG